MSAILSNLKGILNEEKFIFRDIFQLEEEKSEAIIQRDGDLLQSLSNSQEKHLINIQSLERKRGDIIGIFKKKHKIEEGCFVTLKDMVAMEESHNDEIINLGTGLNTALNKMKALQETNSKLINDNMKFFNIIMDGLKGSVTVKTGYSEDGTENKEIANSLILNKTA
ncbi:MAG: flagellar protein FlgN [Spirochaetes bacterium]|jgi:hypothetical protein|nr:flagellar protein FlgN [Spirochaetota bacterium]